MIDLLNFKFEKYTLENGLDVILHQDKSIPLAAVNIWYKVGSAYDPSDKTGLAHLFEHLMFQGSKNVPKGEHFSYVQEAGGNLNGSTNSDRTNYYETVPSNSLELALWLESDRMGFLIDNLNQENLENQIGVVSNERLERYDNQPYGLAWEKLTTSLYPQSHPYCVPTIGFMDHIKSITLDDATSFLKKYYAPDNASLVVAGDIEIEKAKDLVAKYFGDLPKGAKRENPTAENIVLTENKVVDFYDQVQLPRIYLAFPTVPQFHEDEKSLDMLSDILSGSKNSRLHRKLVLEEEIAMNVSTFQYSMQRTGLFLVVITPKPGVNIQEIVKKTLDIIENAAVQVPTETEITKSKNSIKSLFIYSLQELENFADTVNEYNVYLNNPNSFGYELEKFQSLQKDNILSVLNKYLIGKNYLQLNVLPKENGVEE